MNENIFTMIRSLDGLEQALVYGLLLCSLFLWALAFLKYQELKEARRNAQTFLSLFDSTSNLLNLKDVAGQAGESPQRNVYLAALRVLEGQALPLPASGSGAGRPRSIEELLLLNMQHTAKAFFARLHWGLSFMGTLGSTTPFIGLFGTVWGIIVTFQALGEAQSPSMKVVAPGISSALIATAAGLAVAIPAVMFYNWLGAEIQALQAENESFIERLDLLGRAHLARPAKEGG